MPAALKGRRVARALPEALTSLDFKPSASLLSLTATLVSGTSGFSGRAVHGDRAGLWWRLGFWLARASFIPATSCDIMNRIKPGNGRQKPGEFLPCSDEGDDGGGN